jgi:hypothetical protein
MAETLPAFTRWVLTQPLGALRPPAHGIRHVTMDDAEALSVVLYRAAPFQVEQFTILPRAGGSSFPDHRHPNVDSIEYFMAGEINFRLRGSWVASIEDAAAVGSDGASLLCGRRLPVRAEDMHGGRVGDGGAVFLSIQRWLRETPPTSVLLDWAGPAHLGISS